MDPPKNAIRAAAVLDPQGLGEGLRRCFPVPTDGTFDVLLERLAHAGGPAGATATERPSERSRPSHNTLLDAARFFRGRRT